MNRSPEKAPPGWDYNPSAWSERLPIIILAMTGFFIAAYLSLYQFRLIDSAAAVLGYSGSAATNDRIVGPLVATFAIVAMWEITRALRRVNLLLRAWLLLAPFILDYSSFPAGCSGVAAGAILIAMSFLGGGITQRIGGGWRALWRDDGGSVT